MRTLQLGLTPAQIAKRRNYIGGSDAKTIMSGLDDAVYSLWQEKRGECAPDDLSDILAVQMGSFTEPLNLFWFEKKTGLEVTRDGEPVVSAEFPFMACTLDGFVASENAVVQCKHVSGREPFETIVERYTPQVQHEMIVTGASKAYLSVFLGSGEWRCEAMHADPFYAAALIGAEATFWDCVLTGKPPCAAPPVAVPAGEAKRVADMSGSNSWATNASFWLLTREEAATFDAAQKELKALVESDVCHAFGHGVEAKRDRRGAIRFKEMAR